MAAEHDARGVVITGIGVVSAFGRGIDPLWDALLRGLAAPVERQGGVRVAPIGGHAPPPNLDAEAARRLGRCSLFAADAAIQAVEDARLPFTAQTAPVIGLSFGSEHGDPESSPGAPAAAVARILGIAGPVIALAGPSAGALAIGEAYEMVRRGATPVVVAGGSEGLLSERLAGLEIASNAARPFDKDRDGVIPGEGSAAVVVEAEEIARERGARVYARLIGYGAAFSRATVISPAMNYIDAARALQAALLRGDLFQGEIDCLFASAAGSVEGDAIEAKALAELWGPNVDRLTITSAHGALGHTLGAAGAISLAIALKSMQSETVPATVGLTQPDHAFSKLDIVTGEARPYRFSTAAVNCFSAGTNVSLIVRAE
jgi:3-oxoacyl-[acyl-carrier-protein] synthase II